MPYMIHGHDKVTHQPRSELICSATSIEDAIAQAAAIGIEVDRVEDVTTPTSAVLPNSSGAKTDDAPLPEHRNLIIANTVGIAFVVFWAVIVLSFGWYWMFPDAKGSFSFGQLLLAVLPAPVFYAIGKAIGEQLGMRAIVGGGIIAAIVVGLLYSRSLSPPPGDRPASHVSWVQFTSDSGGFSVLMPGTPEESQETRPFLSFSLTAHMFNARIAGGPEDCSVSYTDYSESMMKWMAMTPNEMLDHSCRGMEAGGRGKLMDVRPVALAGYPGRDVMCERNQQGDTWFVRSRIYLVDRRLYQLGFASRRQERVSSKDIDAFLASFKLIEKSAKKGHAE